MFWENITYTMTAAEVAKFAKLMNRAVGSTKFKQSKIGHVSIGIENVKRMREADTNSEYFLAVPELTDWTYINLKDLKSLINILKQ